MENPETSWENGPLGDPHTAFDVGIGALAEVALDRDTPSEQRSNAMGAVVTLMAQNVTVAEQWYADNQPGHDGGQGTNRKAA